MNYWRGHQLQLKIGWVNSKKITKKHVTNRPS